MTKVTIARAEQGSEGTPGEEYSLINGRVVYDDERSEPYMCRVTWSAGSNQGELQEYYCDELTGHGAAWEEAIEAITEGLCDPEFGGSWVRTFERRQLLRDLRSQCAESCAGSAIQLPQKRIRRWPK